MTRTDGPAQALSGPEGAWLVPYVPRASLAWDGDPGHRRVEGTLVSADISGFTSLGERLAGLGREGSEELTAILSERFSTMIEAVEERGGDVLKFGGDALLCWFEGPGHAGRALHAAARMRASLRNKVRSSFAGAVKLGISIGMHSGRHDLFLVPLGDALDLLPAGPAATATITAEATADAGDILCSAASAPYLPEGAVAGERDGHLVLRPAGPDRRHRRAPTGTDPARFVQPGLRAWLQVHARTFGEHRIATIIFVKIGGTDADILAGHTGRFLSRLGELFAHASSVCDRHGVAAIGTDVDRDGLKLILAAGAPARTLHDETSALWVARQLQDDCRQFDLRVGVNRGPVFLGNLGSPQRRVHTVMGDAVNLAARLMAKAGPGEVIASQSVLDHADVSVETTPLEPFLVKGKSEPVHAARLDAIRPRVEVYDAGADVPFVGRREELAVLRSTWATAQGGAGAAVVVTGELGRGKSRLVAELAAEARPEHLIRARGYIGGRQRPYAFVRDPLRQAIGMATQLGSDSAARALTRWFSRHLPERVPLLPLVAPAFDTVLPATVESDQIRPEYAVQRIADIVVEALDAALGGPSLLLFEDIDFADEASRQIVTRITEASTERPWLTIVSARDEEFLPEPATHLRLEPLDAAALRSIVRTRSAGRLAPTTVDELVERAAGNALFALELAAGGDAAQLPDSVDAAVAARLDSIPVEVRQRVLDAAVLGLETELTVLGSALDLPTDAAAWSAADSFVAIAGDRLRYRHALYQEVAYQQLAFRRRRALHRVVGEWFEAHRPADVQTLSGQWSAAGEHPQAWRYSVVAAEAAQARFALRDALSLYRRAIGHGRRLTDLDRAELGRVAEQVADIAELSGEYDEARGAYDEARTYFGRTLTAEVRLLRKVGVLEERRARYSSALRWYGRAKRLIDEHAGDAAHALLPGVHLGVAAARYRQGDYDRCLAAAEDAAAAARIAGDERSLAHAYFLMESVHTFRGRSTDHGERALSLFRRVGDDLYVAHTLNNLGTAAYFAGRWDEAIENWTEFTATMRAAGAIAFAAQGANNLGEVHSDQGRHRQAREHLEDALAGFEASAYELGRLLVTANLARLDVRTGDVRRGVAGLREALEGFRRIGSDYYASWTEVRLLEAAAVADDPDQVAELLGSVDPSGAGDPTLAAAIGRIDAWLAARTGDAARARERIAAVLARADADGNAFELGLTLLMAEAVGLHHLDRDPWAVLAPLGVARHVAPPGAAVLSGRDVTV